MHGQETLAPNRRAAFNALAVVGFIALIGASMWLAVYSARYVPDVASRLGGAAVYLGSLFVPAADPSLSVVPTASTTPFDSGSISTATGTIPKSKPAATGTTVTPGKAATSTYQIGGGATAASSALRGLSDLIVRINAVGYLATSSAESFVASTTVPAGNRPAVNFTIENIGTNASGAWRFSANIPTQTNFLFLSQFQQSLLPGDRIDYTLGFDQANKGADKLITVIANFDHSIGESNTNNNTASAKLTIIGGS